MFRYVIYKSVLDSPSISFIARRSLIEGQAASLKPIAVATICIAMVADAVLAQGLELFRSSRFIWHGADTDAPAVRLE